MTMVPVVMAVPMPVVPIMPMVPVTVMPVTVMPMPVVPVAVVVPANLFRLDPIDVVLRYDGGLRTSARVNRRCGVRRRHRGGLRWRRKHGGHRNKSKSELQQKVSALHGIRPFSGQREGEFPNSKMNVR